MQTDYTPSVDNIINSLMLERQDFSRKIALIDEVVARLQNISSALGSMPNSELVATSLHRPKNPKQEVVAKHVREILLEAKDTLSKREVVRRLASRGVHLQGKNVTQMLNTMLWRCGAQFGIETVPYVGVRLKEGKPSPQQEPREELQTRGDNTQ